MSKLTLDELKQEKLKQEKLKSEKPGMQQPVKKQQHDSGEHPIRQQWEEARKTGEWQDWRWQFRHRVTDVETLKQLIEVSPEEEKAFLTAGKNLPFAVTPYYMTLVDHADPDSPIRKTVIPRMEELTTTPFEMVDPCGEDHDSPVPGLVHRYPDRVLFLVNDMCSVYCRYCTRSRVVGSGDLHPEYTHVYEYLEKHTEIRDVLISGGDPLVFSDDKLEDIVSRLRQIPHIEIVRIGTKIPVVMPQRVTDELVNRLKKYHPFYMSIHFLHPDEITPEVTEACNRLADAGIPTFSQTVLLKGVNDDPVVMKRLMQQLLMLRVRPYYIYQCDPVQGTQHFRTSIQTGLDIMEHLRGHTTGYAIPTYVVDAPGGGGKIPVSPDYVLSKDDEKVVLRNYAGETYEYHLE
jgi:lysine 2,3-aminomutase